MIPSSSTSKNGWGTKNDDRAFSSITAPRVQLQATVVEDDALMEMTTNGTQNEMEDASSSSLDPLEGLTSKPVPGGNWDPERPIEWAKSFGRRGPEEDELLQSLIRLKPGDEGYYDNSDITFPKATIVRTREQARKVMEVLMNADPEIFHACDTEVMAIKLKEVGPVGNGYVTCVSVYSGPDFDYGLGDGPGTTLWIDNLDEACGILQEFKDWFEDSRFLKVWHNYGFDRHVMWNEGIDCQGFGGDTMHMARLQDTSRLKHGQGYSLEALTSELLDLRKRPMKEIFGVPRIRKDGTPGSLVDIPPIEVLQRDPKFRENFIMYSCYDAEGTWQLHEKLVGLLKKMNWLTNGMHLYDYYWTNMREFGHVLTDMERRGIRVDAKDYLSSVETQARKDRKAHSRAFREWAAKKIGPDGFVMNPASSTQLATFLFGGSVNKKTGERTETVRTFKTAREELPEDALEDLEKRELKRAEGKLEADPILLHSFPETK
jgi:DNA polymerase-1